MNDHDLDDLIIDTKPQNTDKTKNPLTIFALLIIILILAIIFSKNLLVSPENAALNLDNNDSAISAPELMIQNDTEDEEPEAVEAPTKESLGTDAPLSSFIAQRHKTPVDNMLKIQMPKEKNQKDDSDNVESVKEETTQKIDESHTATTAEASKVVPLEEIKKIAKGDNEVAQEETVVKPKPVIKRHVYKKPKVVKKVPKSVASGRYFIQVGSFQQTPSKRFLSVIRNSGFKYVISRPNSKGSKKLLIGPYGSKADANQALITVKSRINKSAYIVHK